jgi:hypothetical protein
MSEKQFLELENKILTGLKLTYVRLIEFKKRKKTNLVIQRNDEVIRVKPEEL